MLFFSVIIGSIWVVLTRRVGAVHLRIWDPSLPYADRRLHFDKISTYQDEAREPVNVKKPYGIWEERLKLSIKGEPGGFLQPFWKAFSVLFFGQILSSEFHAGDWQENWNCDELEMFPSSFISSCISVVEREPVTARRRGLRCAPMYPAAPTS